MMVRRPRRAMACVLLVAVILIVVGSLSATVQFRDRARAREDAALALAEFETDTLLLGRAEDAAFAADFRAATPPLELARARSAFDLAGGVALRSLPAGQRAELDATIRAYESAVDKVAALAGAGRIGEGRVASKALEEPAFAKLREKTEALTARSQGAASLARREADGGSVAILLFSILGVVGLVGAAGFARRRALRAEAEGQGVRRSEARFRALVDHGDDMILVTDAQARIREATEPVSRVLGLNVDELVGSRLTELVHPDERAAVASLLERVATGADGFVARSDWRWRHDDGSWRHIESSVTNLLTHPEVAGVVLNARDVTERHRLEDELRHRAFHDSLTGLANRSLLQDRIAHAMARRDGDTALVLLNLDGFRALNDNLGNSAGDHVLIVVADRLRGLVRAEDTAARLGGDEFAVLLEQFAARSDVEALASRLVRRLAEPLDWEGHSIVIGASVGVAFVNGGLHGPAELVRDAGVALNAAKRVGRGQVRTFALAMGAAAAAGFTLEGELRKALDHNEFVLHYQPVVELESARVVGFEALVRWVHPDRGLVPPLQFIPVAEDSGLIVPLGRWVLAEACRAAVGWSDEHPNHGAVQIAVNLSVRQLQDHAIIADVTAALAASGLDPARLVLEVTESVLMHDVEQAMERLGALKALGVRLAVDDFGTGYSSLSYLRRFPFDTVKIDKSFVDGVAAGGDDAAFVEAILALADATHMETLAEGIETADQAQTLTRLHCRLGQGFYFARPLEAAAIERLLSAAPDVSLQPPEVVSVH